MTGMRLPRAGPGRSSTTVVFVLALLAGALCTGPASAASDEPGPSSPRVAAVVPGSPVTLVDAGDRWTLDNGLVRLTVQKRNAEPVSIVYRGIEVLTRGRYWEQSPSGVLKARVTIDPATNGGERAEVAVSGVDPDHRGPAGAIDIETRYTVERNTSGFYTYAQYTHPATYPLARLGESRFMLENLAPTFDWMSVDADRNLLMSQAPETVRVHAPEQSIYTSGLYRSSVEHKYSYSARRHELTAWGWSSTKDRIGVYLVNPSREYLGGGPDRIDLTAHLSAPGSTLYLANVLDYWTSGHYAGGDTVTIPAGQAWRKVVGPLFVYFNALADAATATPAQIERLAATSGSGQPEVPPAWRDNGLALWRDAVAAAERIGRAWPFDWVQGVDYPAAAGRATVDGQIVLDDPDASSPLLPRLHVGLAHADYRVPASPVQRRAGNGDVVTWPHDAAYYQFWTEGSADGRFHIADVRPGSYVLHAYADGVLGEFESGPVTVAAGQRLDLGRLGWHPVRYGRPVWEIGVADRSGDEYFKGDRANDWLWGWGLRYAGLFPDDIVYTIGRSDYHRDWFFQQVPRARSTAWRNPDATDPYHQRFGWVRIPPAGSGDPWAQWGQGDATTWTVAFAMPAVPHGVAALRIALAGADGEGGLAIGVNGRSVGTLHPIATNALRYNTDKGVWYQYVQPFDAALLKAGDNTITFTVPAGDVTTGVVWDYLRLELNDGGGSYPPLPATQRPDAP